MLGAALQVFFLDPKTEKKVRSPTMMSIFVCEEEELEHKVEKIDDEDDCYGSSEDMTESQLNASLYILGQAHYSKSLIYVQKCKNLDFDPELDFRKIQFKCWIFWTKTGFWNSVGQVMSKSRLSLFHLL